MPRKHVLRHLKRRQRHVVLQPLGQQTEHSAREKLLKHGQRYPLWLIGRYQASRSGLDDLGDIILDQPLESSDTLATQHQPLNLLALCHVLEEPDEVGRWIVQREYAGRRMRRSRRMERILGYYRTRPRNQPSRYTMMAIPAAASSAVMFT